MVELAVIHADPLGLLVAFGAGMLSFLSPCVLPLVPAYVSMVSGLSAAELRDLRPVASPPSAPVATEVVAPAAMEVALAGGPSSAGPSSAGSTAVAAEGAAVGGVTSGAVIRPQGLSPEERRRLRGHLIRGILAFIAGFTVVFTILGASASALGRLFLTHQRSLDRASGILIVIFGALLVVMASGVRLPLPLAAERRFHVRPSTLGVWAPPVLGMAFAFAWTPCIGPVLGSVLTLAAGTGGSATGGIALLLAYSLGLGVPFLLAGLLFGRMTDALARVRSGLRWVNLIGGVIMIVFGLLLLTGNVAIIADHLSNWFRDLHLTRLSEG
jgi:cytochrome c-type biogenesis protein